MPYAVQGTLVDRSGSIGTGGASQEVAPANEARFYLFIQNISSGDLWINFGEAATTDQPSIKLVANAALELSSGSTGWVPEEVIYIVGETTGQSFVVKEVSA